MPRAPERIATARVLTTAPFADLPTASRTLKLRTPNGTRALTSSRCAPSSISLRRVPLSATHDIRMDRVWHEHWFPVERLLSADKTRRQATTEELMAVADVRNYTNDGHFTCRREFLIKLLHYYVVEAIRIPTNLVT